MKIRSFKMLRRKFVEALIEVERHRIRKSVKSIEKLEQKRMELYEKEQVLCGKQ